MPSQQQLWRRCAPPPSVPVFQSWLHNWTQLSLLMLFPEPLPHLSSCSWTESTLHRHNATRAKTLCLKVQITVADVHRLPLACLAISDVLFLAIHLKQCELISSTSPRIRAIVEQIFWMCEVLKKKKTLLHIESLHSKSDASYKLAKLSCAQGTMQPLRGENFVVSSLQPETKNWLCNLIWGQEEVL